MTTTQTCNLPHTKPETSKTKKFIRRLKQLVAPTHCRIRYDSMEKRWAVLKDDNTPHHYFEYGVMTNVTFHTAKLGNYDTLLCGSNRTAGIAEGDLRENFYGNDGVGFAHMSFDGNSFVDESTHKPIQRANVLRLMTERHALYK